MPKNQSLARSALDSNHHAMVYAPIEGSPGASKAPRGTDSASVRAQPTRWLAPYLRERFRRPTPVTLTLRAQTSPLWLKIVLEDFDTFLRDHAAAERKASAVALSLISHYPDRQRLVAAMMDLAREELEHFYQVYRRLEARGLTLAKDTKDDYVQKLRQQIRSGREDAGCPRRHRGRAGRGRRGGRARVSNHCEAASLLRCFSERYTFLP